MIIGSSNFYPIFGLAVFLFSCSSTSQEVHVREFVKRNPEGEVVYRDTLILSGNNVFLRGGDEMLKHLHAWDSSIRRSEGVHKIVVDSENYIIMDSSYMLVSKGSVWYLHSYFIHHQMKLGGELTTRGIYMDGIGSIYYRPWDSHDEIRLERRLIFKGDTLEAMEFSEVHSLLDSIILQRHLKRAQLSPDEDDEIGEPIELDLEGLGQ